MIARASPPTRTSTKSAGPTQAPPTSLSASGSGPGWAETARGSGCTGCSGGTVVRRTGDWRGRAGGGGKGAARPGDPGVPVPPNWEGRVGGGDSTGGKAVRRGGIVSATWGGGGGG